MNRGSLASMANLPEVDNVNQAGFAMHAWRLLNQYEELTKDLDENERYDATLTLCVVQAMLTACIERLNYLEDLSPTAHAGLKVFTQDLRDHPEVHEANTFAQHQSAKDVLNHIRCALSHPRQTVTDPPTTGFMTESDGSGLVRRITFTNSPDIDSKGKAAKRLRNNQAEAASARYFTIELPLTMLAELAKETAWALAEPIRQAEQGSHAGAD